MSAPSPVTFVAWTERSGRANEIAAALGGESFTVFPRWLGRRKAAPLRYVVSVLWTFWHLVVKRPQAVIVTNPPVFAGLTVWLYSVIFRRTFVLDSHPTSFGAKDHRVAQRLMPLHRFLARRASAVAVTTDQWVRVVESWGGRSFPLHESPLHESPSAWPTQSEFFDRKIDVESTHQPFVLFPGIFGGDEPIAEILDAARLVPTLGVAITGDLARCSPELRTGTPDNVQFTGWLDATAYAALLRRADVVLALSTEPTSVMRAAYEAVYARRPLVASDTSINRELFPTAIYVDPHDSASIANGLLTAFDNRVSLLGAAQEAEKRQFERWQAQLLELRTALGLDASDRTRSRRPVLD